MHAKLSKPNQKQNILSIVLYRINSVLLMYRNILGHNMLDREIHFLVMQISCNENYLNNHLGT